MSAKTIIETKTYKVYDDCTECPIFEKFNENNEIKLILERKYLLGFTITGCLPTKPQEAILKKSDTIIDKDGNVIKNPAIGYCYLLEILINDVKKPIPHSENIKDYNITNRFNQTGECSIKHLINEISEII